MVQTDNRSLSQSGRSFGLYCWGQYRFGKSSFIMWRLGCRTSALLTSKTLIQKRWRKLLRRETNTASTSFAATLKKSSTRQVFKKTRSASQAKRAHSGWARQCLTNTTRANSAPWLSDDGELTRSFLPAVSAAI